MQSGLGAQGAYRAQGDWGLRGLGGAKKLGVLGRLSFGMREGGANSHPTVLR